jgi:phosphohistidine swiveling domain-containing protein
MTDEQILEKIRETDWKYLVNRKETMLMASLTENSYARFYEVTEIPWHATKSLRAGTYLMLDSNEFEQLIDLLKAAGTKGLRDLLNKLYKLVGDFDTLSERLQKLDTISLSLAELEQELRRYSDAALTAHVFLSPMAMADRVLASLIIERLPKSSDEQSQKWLGVLTYPERGNTHVQEERSFLRLAQAKMDQDSRFTELLSEHLGQFGWIGARSYWWNLEWTAEVMESRIAHFISKKKDPDRELARLDELRKENQKAFEKLLDELSISKESEFYELIRLAKEYAYARTWRTDVIYRAGYRARELFYEILRRAERPLDDIFYMSFEDVLTTAAAGTSPVSGEEIQRRKEHFSSVVLDGTFYVLSGKEWKEKLQGIGVLAPEVTDKIQGSTAYPGIAKGPAKVVYGGNDIKKVNRGDVLVAVMTFPNFVPAMEKAAAFVTDEGGILCHAAIVAREMQKPCIIGTKFATRLLKDGDLIEVDAENGIVRIIDKSD